MKAINRIKYWLVFKVSDYRYVCVFSMVVIILSISGYWLERLRGKTTPYFEWLINLSLNKIELLAIVASVFAALLTIEQNARIAENFWQLLHQCLPLF